MNNHVVFFSGGVSSWACAHRVAEKYGTDNLTLLFTDTLIEDADLYRFLEEGAAAIGGQLVKIADGRTPWEVFRDVKYLGNTRADPCSRILKRDIAKKYIHENFPQPEDVRLWLGMNWDEEDRLVRSKRFWEPYRMDSLLMEKPWLTQGQMHDLLAAHGIAPPRLTASLGFPHNNCGGGCVKAGQAHFRHLLKTLPDVYREWENNEQEMREFLDKDVSILRDRTGGTTKPLTLRELRERESGQCDLTDWGGCGCFAVDEENDD